MPPSETITYTGTSVLTTASISSEARTYNLRVSLGTGTDFTETLCKDLKRNQCGRSLYQCARTTPETIHKMRTHLSTLTTTYQTPSIYTRPPILPHSHPQLKPFSHRLGSFQCPDKNLNKNSIATSILIKCEKHYLTPFTFLS